MKQYDIGIDLGTTSIIIATEEQGVVFRQPTIGAVDTRTNSIIAVGDAALKMVGRAPAHIDLVRPLRDGIIQDHRMTNELIVRFVNEVCRSRFFKPRIAVCVPAAITGIEADAVVESVMAAGAKQVFLVDEPVAAALGAGLQIRQPHGCMVVDIGGGSTDIAVISMGGRVKAASLPTMMNYTTLLNADSMYNTPPCWCIYMTGLVMDYLEHEVGGLENMKKINAAKAKVLYDYLDGQDFYRNPVQKEYRSMMNVTFTSPDADTDKAFCAAAAEAGFVNLKGHRLVGGMRASIYNAMPPEGIDKLVDFMEKFRKEH